VGLAGPQEKRLVCLDLTLDEILGAGLDFVVNGLHPFLRQRPGVFDFAVGSGVDHAPGTVFLLELGVLGIIRLLRFFFSVEVIEVAVELVKAMVGWQVLVPVSQMVLAKLARGITHIF